jgi:hypothetical protein
MTLLWFLIWFISNLVGDHEDIVFNPANAWATTLLLVLALDLSRAGGLPGRG